MVGGFAGFTHDPAHRGQTDCCQIALVKKGGACSVSFNADHPVVWVIPPFLMGVSRRIHAAVFSFIAGVMPPMAMLGRSLL